ncbi:MAG: DUF2723 domain-containing protein [Bacteroidia bacterium]|nr:DUF2723 domain-containing protein [Bacteroidia bacterium]
MYKIFNNVVGWLVFIAATFTYVATIEPTASFWDCGEYISCAAKLEVGHPPGAPFFLLLGRIFIWLGGDNPTTMAKWVNVLSALCSSFTILFLYWSITRLGVKMVKIRKQEFTSGRQMAVIISGIIGGLAYCFSDSFWFSAVEGEVYAMSSLFTAVAFWAILKWEEEADNPSSVRWLIFLAYLIGLSIGVHLLNLLVIPAVVFIFYFRKYKFKFWSFCIAGVVSIILLGGIQGLLIPKIVKFSADYELFFTNKLHAGFSTGTVIYFVLLLVALLLGILSSIKRNKGLHIAFIVTSSLFALLVVISGHGAGAVFTRIIVVGGIVAGLAFLQKRPKVLHHILVSFVVLLMGYSTYFVLVIRSQANTPMDENNPENAISLLSYLNREQYGDWPILYGPYYNAELDPAQPYKDGEPIYGKNKETGRYEVIDDRKNSIPNYDKNFCTIFPRMWSQQGGHESSYRVWGQIEGRDSGKRDDKDNPVMVPTFGENLRYFWHYQMGYMYWRYFMWNFVGKQNDIQGLTNNVSEGNAISGFNGIDKAWTGIDQQKMPYATRNNKATNHFYFLPLILGLIGFIFHCVRHPKDFFVCLLLFFFTGIAIVIYLNQYPFQPRERDYAYAASFYVFTVWIGIGVFAIFELLNVMRLPKVASASVAALLTLWIPFVMAKDGWDDHDRSKRTMARDFAINYLQTCEKNAVLFTNGDNDTFPLWYAQETEGIRTDVRVINLSLLQTDWYIDQQRRAAYDSPPVPFTLSADKYVGSKREQILLIDEKVGYRTVKDVIDFVASDDTQYKKLYNERYYDYIPTQQLRIPVDSAKVMSIPNLVPKGMENRIVKSVDWELKKQYILKNDLMILDLLAGFEWKRPVYFAVTTGPESYLSLQNYFQLEGLAYRLVPIKSKPEEMVHGTRVAADIMYNNIFNKPFQFGGMKTPGVNLDENCNRMAQNMRIQMTTLASVLIEEGKTDKAKKVLDKMMEEMPEVNVPYDATLYTAVLCRYQLRQYKEGNMLAKRLFDIFEEDFFIYDNMANDYKVAYGREVEQCAAVMQRLESIAKTYNQNELAQEFKARLTQMGLAGPEGPQPAQPTGPEMKLPLDKQ